MADYDINAVTRRVVYSGASGLGPYAFAFEILEQTDVVAYFNATKLTLTTDYTVTINSNGTGSVNIVTGGSVPSTPTASDQVVLVGSRDIERTTDFVTAGELRASALNEQLDSLTIFDQQLAEENKRTIRAPVYDPALVEDGGVVDMTLPEKASRAGKTLAFDDDGNPIAGEDIGNWRGDWAASVAYDVRDLVRDPVDLNIYRVNTAHTSSGVAPLTGNADYAKFDLVIDAASVADAEAAQLAAEAARDAAQLAQAAAETAETNAELAETNAGNSATASAASATASASSASDAATSETNAATSETNAATSATNAATSASNAASSADEADLAQEGAQIANASSQQSSNSSYLFSLNSASSASDAAASASSASSAQTAAEAARDSALAAFDNFDDKYLGEKAADPTVDNDGDPLVAGALYFNTTDDAMKVYNGTSWVDAYADGATLVSKSGDTMTGDLSFGDNDKAIFGAGSDLQIYHDGSHSWIKDAGSGNIYISSDGYAVNFVKGDNVATVAQFIPDGPVNLYNAGSLKLATTASGIDVTGTVTAEGLTISDDYPQIIFTDTNSNPDWTLIGANGRIGFYNASSAVEVATITSTGIDVTGTVTAYGLYVDGNITSTGNATFGDNDKAIFGAGSDLQIYHDGSHSYITDVGTGSLYIRGQQNIEFQNGSGSETYARFVANGTAKLFYDGSEKFTTTATGVTIDGTVTADGLTVVGSGSAIRYNVASSNPHTHPTLHLENQDTTDGNVAGIMLSADNAAGVAGSAYIYAQSETANQKGNLLFAREDGANNPTTSMKLSSNGDISFYEDTGTTAKFFWDASAERLGLGTTSPAAKIDVVSDAAFLGKLTATNGYIDLVDTSVTGRLQVSGNVFYMGTTASGDVVAFKTGANAERMRIDASGNVGIGTSSPDARLSIVDGTSSDQLRIGSSTSYYKIGRNTSTGLLEFNGIQSGFNGYVFGGANGERMRIDSSGNVGIGTVPPSTYWGTGDSVSLFTPYGYLGSNGNFAVSLYSNGYRNSSGGFTYLGINGNTSAASGIDLNPNGLIQFRTGTASGTVLPERMRITSTGLVGIGTSSPSRPLHIYNATDTGLYLQSSDAATSMAMADTGGSVLVGQTSGALQFYTGGDANTAGYLATEAMRIDISGNVLVGKTSASSATVGFQAGQDGFIAATRASGQPLVLNRTTTDGIIADFRKDGTTVGTIGVEGGDNFYITDNNNTGLNMKSGLIIPCNTNGSTRDNAIDLGASGGRFNDLYLGGGVYLGGTGSANKLDDYEEGTFTATLTATTTAPTTPVTTPAKYTKIGNLVTVHIDFGARNTTGASGSLQVTGLPFTSGYSVDQTGCPWHYNITPSGDLVAAVEYFSTNIKFRVQGVGTIPSIAPDSASYLRLTITYLAL